MKNFALIGAAGYVAPRHMKAIKETGNKLVAALDKCDSVGILDHFFPEADFFTEFERFDRHIDKLKRQGISLDYVSICSPNYLHDAHIRWALRIGADAVCEKPLVLNPWNLDALEDLERETGHRVWNILQLRVHPNVIKLKQKVEKEKNKIYDVELLYLTGRGKWYFFSWKGDMTKSGGVVSNIGIHFFDMLIWIFGRVKYYEVHYSDPVKKMAGYLELERARVKWFLSVDLADIPDEVIKKGGRTYRSLVIEGEKFNFDSGFTDLHTEVYKKILSGGGFGISEARPSIELTYKLRHAKPIGLNENTHNYVFKVIKNA